MKHGVKPSETSAAAGTLIDLKAYNDVLQEFDLKTLNTRLQILTDPAQHDVTPLLKFYDQLASHTKFMIPSKEILEMDRQIFKKMIRSLRNAQRTEL